MLPSPLGQQEVVIASSDQCADALGFNKLSILSSSILMAVSDEAAVSI